MFIQDLSEFVISQPQLITEVCLLISYLFVTAEQLLNLWGNLLVPAYM